MKKLTITALIAFCAIAVTSCSKTSDPDLVRQQTSSNPPPRPEVNVVSNWLTPVSFTLGTDRSGNPFAQAVYPFTSANQMNYNEDTHVELVYARTPTNQRMTVYQYRKLPMTVTIDVNNRAGDVLVDHSVDPDALRLYFRNTDFVFISKAVDLSVSENWNFRYIVIPKSRYQSLNIDWNDLVAVATALNFSL